MQPDRRLAPEAFAGCFGIYRKYGRVLNSRNSLTKPVTVTVIERRLYEKPCPARTITHRCSVLRPRDAGA